MASGQQLAEQYLVTFTAWLATKTDAEFRAMASRGVLSRKEVAKECGFSPSVLTQNPRVNSMLKEKEGELRDRGVLPPVVRSANDDVTEAPTRVRGKSHAAADAEYLKRLETENASLRAELAEVKRKLERYELLDEALATTGRLLR